MAADDPDELDILRRAPLPRASDTVRVQALAAALAAFDENSAHSPQGTKKHPRLTDRAINLWRGFMQKKFVAVPGLAALVGLPLAGLVAFEMARQPSRLDAPEPTVREAAKPEVPRGAPAKPAAIPQQQAARDAVQPASEAEVSREAFAEPPPVPAASVAAAPADADSSGSLMGSGRSRAVPASPKLMQEAAPAGVVAADMPMPQEENRDRFQDFSTNPIHVTREDPVSTFSLDVDTASYSFVRRSLKEGFLPQPDTVRVEELINYFPYDWKGPAGKEEPFATTVTVMPSPWNAGTRLMHVAVKGYDVQPAARPHANLVFLLDVSGSMDEPDKLPLLQSAFRLLVGTLAPEDTVSIVTYAGEAGTVLEPTKAADKAKILEAIDKLQPGGSTAGSAGIDEAYRLAQKSFVTGGINRVMLATDGDFNVGQTDDDQLKRLVEEKRQSGVFLSVFGFGRGNLNDGMMQVLAQNGNGTAAYIDTLAEAEKVLVQDATSTLFPIAKDVKIQVEFNPEKVSEYRLIGYETRALKREDFNNDRVDAGEVGSGSSVTAIYEITPKGSPSESVDALRYGEATANNASGVAHGDEYAFVKIRYKLPDADTSKLTTVPVTDGDAVSSFDAAGVDQRFSVAVAAFGQKLRNEDATAKLNFQRIAELASAARGNDPFGYRSEFLSLLRLAAALEQSKP